MKNPTPRELLIKKAATDHADGGTEWRDRMAAWLKAHEPKKPTGNWTQRFGPTWCLSSLTELIEA